MNNVTQLPEPIAMKRVFNVDDSGNSQGPEQLHPGQIDFAGYDNNPALRQASETLGYAFEGLASIDRLRGNPHPEHTAARHARSVREAVDGFDHAWAHKWDSAKAALKAEHRRVEADLEKAANLEPIETRFNAICGTLQSMAPGEKAQTIDRLIADQDGPTLATIIEAPLFLTGITAEQRDNIKLRLFNAINPAGVKLRDQLAKSLAKMEAASIACIHARAKLRDGSERFTARSKEAEALANKAGFGFAA